MLGSIYKAIYIHMVIGFIRRTATKLCPSTEMPRRRYAVTERTGGVFITSHSNDERYILAECASMELARAFCSSMDEMNKNLDYKFSTFENIGSYNLAPNSRQKLAESGIYILDDTLDRLRDRNLALIALSARSRALS